MTTDEAGGMIIGFCNDPERNEVDIILNDQSHQVALWDGLFDIDLDWAEGENTIKIDDQTVTFMLQIDDGTPADVVSYRGLEYKIIADGDWSAYGYSSVMGVRV